MSLATQSMSHTEPRDAADDVETLLGRCALRDRRAFAELYEHASPQVFGVLMKMLRSRALAEEALQDTMVRVWQRAEQFEAYRGRGMAWIVSIARNRAIDLLRAQRPTVSIDVEDARELPDDNGHDMFDLSATGRMRAALSSCFGGLSNEQRQCITLAFVKGYSHDQIARSVGSPLGSVKSWVRRGLASLKRCLES